jgi:hypothetical protein
MASFEGKGHRIGAHAVVLGATGSDPKDLLLLTSLTEAVSVRGPPVKADLSSCVGPQKVMTEL